MLCFSSGYYQSYAAARISVSETVQDFNLSTLDENRMFIFRIIPTNVFNYNITFYFDICQL